jgi:transposase
MAASSIDLRQRLPLPGNADSTHRGPWRPVRVSPTSAEQGLRKPRTTGTIAPEPHAGGQCPRLDKATHGLLRQLVRDDPDLTLHELCTRIASATGMRVSVPAMCRVLRRLDLPRKQLRSTRRRVVPRASSKRGRTTGS